MQIAGKIQNLLQETDIVRFRDLDQYFDQKQITEGFISFGLAHPTQMACSFIAKNRDTNGLLSGTLLMKRILEFYRNPNIIIEKLNPIAVFNEKVNLQTLIQQRNENLVKKQGVIMPRKLRTRLPQKKQVKSQFGKKNKNAAIDTSQTQQKNKKKMEMKTKSLKSETKIEQKNEVKLEVKKEQEQKKQQVNSKPLQIKAKLKVSSQSDSEERMLKQYEISAPIKNQNIKLENPSTKQEVKQEDQEKQLENKIQEIDLDEIDAFELLLQKKNKQKVNEKIENKNINTLNNKVEKKTTDKSEGQVKPKQAMGQNTQVKSGQPNLFSFFNKKMG